MTFELRDFRWAVIASHHKSLRKAAEALNVRQSTLSRRLRSLEDEVGTTLFERSNGGTHATIAGQEFLEAARRILEETDAISDRLRTWGRGESGGLRIGVHSSLSAGNLRATLIEYRRRFPKVQVHLVDGSSDYLMSDIASSAIDVAFVAEQDLRWHEKYLSVWSERVVVAIPETHALFGNDIVHWHDLRGESVLLPQRGPGAEFRKLLDKKSDIPDACDIQQHDVSLDRLLTLVSVGLGVLLALEGATGASYPAVAFREVHDDHGPSRLGFHAIWRNENSNPSLARFLDMLRERYPDLSGEPPAA